MSEPVDTSAQAVRTYVLQREVNGRFHHYVLRDDFDRLQSALTAAHQRLSEQETLLAERNRDAERFEWFFGDSDKLPFMSNYLLGVRESWTPNQWRAAIDEAMGAREGM